MGWIDIPATAGNATTNLAGDGSPAAPSYAFANSTSTGMYSPGAGQVAIATSGTQALSFNASQLGTFAGAVIVNGGQGVYIKGLSGQASPVADTSVPLQIGTGNTGTEAYIGCNKNGTYGFLLGYSNITTAGWPRGGLMRMVTTDNFSFVMGNNGGNTNAMTFAADGSVGIYAGNANGSTLNIKMARASTTTNGAAGTQTAVQIPAGSLVMGCTTRVTTAITGCTSFNVGDGTTANLWGNNISVNINTTSDGTNFLAAQSPKFYPSATNVVLTAVGGGATFTAGVVESIVFYFSLTAPTS